MPQNDTTLNQAREFATTRWTVVLTAQRQTDPQAHDALEQLCLTYWYPLYAFLRREGYPQHQSEDLIQGFFARFLEKHYLDDVHQDKGRFRSFLLASLKHYAQNERARAHAQKRGGRIIPVPLDTTSAETRYRGEPADPLSPDRLYDRRWALTLLDQVLQNLQELYDKEGKAGFFKETRQFLTGDRNTERYQDVAHRLGMREGALKVAIHRMRHHYRRLLREAVANTVSSPAQVEDELRSLFTALQSQP